MLRRSWLLAAVASAASRPASARDDELRRALAGYEKDTGGRIGLYAASAATGRTFAWRARERFVMCSTFKASLAGLVLLRVDRHEDRLDRSVTFSAGDVPDWHAPVARQHLARGFMSIGEMSRAIVEHSDNTCANLLLAQVGGPSALTAFWRSTGDGVTRLDHDEPELNRSPPGDPHDTTTPFAMAATLRRLVLGDVLSPISRDLLTGWLVECKTGADRLRGGLPTHWKIGDKTGNNGRDAFGDIAVAWPRPEAPVVIALYTQGGTPTAPQVKAIFAAVARMVSQRLA